LLPIYNAHSFDRILKQGGRTQPWVVLINEGDSLHPYVVKMFTPRFVNEFDAVTNEVIGNRLAILFDLPVPKAALINMDSNFISTIYDPEAYDLLNFKDERLKFATRLIAPNIPLEEGAFGIQEIKSIAEIDTVFAFDYLIQNMDRNYKRPNFIINNRRGYLIDHEKGFCFNENFLEFMNNPLLIGGYKNHIFYDYLKRSWNKTKSQYFGTFMEYLRLLNVNDLNSYFLQLSDLGFPIGKHQIITDYLLYMKSNWSKFEVLMKGIIL
jgi:hypothetical protein